MPLMVPPIHTLAYLVIVTCAVAVRETPAETQIYHRFSFTAWCRNSSRRLHRKIDTVHHFAMSHAVEPAICSHDTTIIKRIFHVECRADPSLARGGPPATCRWAYSLQRATEPCARSRVRAARRKHGHSQCIMLQHCRCCRLGECNRRGAAICKDTQNWRVSFQGGARKITVER